MATSAPTTQDLVARLTVAEQRLAHFEARHCRPTRRWRGRGIAILAVALLLALVPYTLLAANPFTDLNQGSVHNANIDAIYNAGITTGCVPDAEYCPNDFVTRQEMASFLARTAGLGANKPVSTAARLSISPAAVGSATFAANDLVRLATVDAASLVGGSAIALATDNPYQLATVTITAPAKGNLVLLGTVSYDNFGAATSREIQTSIIQTAPPVMSIARSQYSHVGSAAGAALQVSVTVTDGRSIAGPGTYTFALFGQLGTGGSGTPRAFNVSLTAIYIPFNGAGN